MPIHQCYVPFLVRLRLERSLCCHVPLILAIYCPKVTDAQTKLKLKITLRALVQMDRHGDENSKVLVWHDQITLEANFLLK